MKSEWLFCVIGTIANLCRETVRLDSVHLDPLYAFSESRPDTYNMTISCGKGLSTALCFFNIGGEPPNVCPKEASV